MMKKPEANKNKWKKPEIRSLKFKQTLGGSTVGEFEGFPYDGSRF